MRIRKVQQRLIKEVRVLNLLALSFYPLKQLFIILQTAAELSCNDTCIDGTFRVPDGKDANAKHILETGNINSINIVPEHEETHSSHGISLQNSHLPKTLEEKQVIELCPLALSFISVYFI